MNSSMYRPGYLCYFLQLIQHCMFMQEKADPLESIDWMYIVCNLGSYMAMINDQKTDPQGN